MIDVCRGNRIVQFTFTNIGGAVLPYYFRIPDKIGVSRFVPGQQGILTVYNSPSGSCYAETRFNSAVVYQNKNTILPSVVVIRHNWKDTFLEKLESNNFSASIDTLTSVLLNSSTAVHIYVLPVYGSFIYSWEYVLNMRIFKRKLDVIRRIERGITDFPVISTVEYSSFTGHKANNGRDYILMVRLVLYIPLSHLSKENNSNFILSIQNILLKDLKKEYKHIQIKSVLDKSPSVGVLTTEVGMMFMKKDKNKFILE